MKSQPGIYPQGLGHYGPYLGSKKDQELRWNQKGARREHPKPEASRPASLSDLAFRHFDYETMPIVCSAINEMLIRLRRNDPRLPCRARPLERAA